jgi:hypothetical protein
MLVDGAVPIVLSAGSGVAAVLFGYSAFRSGTREKRPLVSDGNAYENYGGFTLAPREGEKNYQVHPMKYMEEIKELKDNDWVLFNGVHLGEFTYKTEQAQSYDGLAEIYHHYSLFPLTLNGESVLCSLEELHNNKWQGKYVFLLGKIRTSPTTYTSEKRFVVTKYIGPALNKGDSLKLDCFVNQKPPVWKG